MAEILEQQMKDSDMIFTQISSGDFNSDNFMGAICSLYVPDMSISRSGISHAMTRLVRHYKG